MFNVLSLAITLSIPPESICLKQEKTIPDFNASVMPSALSLKLYYANDALNDRTWFVHLGKL